jgi:DUF4097 and DUF4098 domain-containing protein YvlB
MNIRSRVIYSLAVVFLTACVAGERRIVRIDRKWPAAGIRRVEVREVDGTISIDAGTADQISMQAVVHSRGVPPKQKEENQGYFRSEVDGDTLVIGRREGHIHIGFPLFSRRDVRVDYALRVPSSVELVLHSVNGRIEARGVAGETEAKTVNGEVDIETPGSNEVSAKTVNGRVHATFLSDFHGAHLGTVNGRVIASLPSNASFFGDFTQVNGDFEAAFPLNIHSHRGSRRASGEVNGGRYSLKITTVNGDIKIDNVPATPQAPASTPAATPPAPSAPASPPAPPAIPRT